MKARNIFIQKTVCLTALPNTDNRIENMTRSGVFLSNLVVGV